MSEKIWYKNIKKFYTEENYYIIFPSKDMNFAEQLNSILRFSIYFSIIIIIIKQNINILMLPIILALFTYFLYNTDESNKINETMMLNENNLKKNENTKELCQKPTKDNPFMNVLISDYKLNPTRKKACNITHASTKKKVEKYFNDKLYRSTSDIFNKEASDRQWVTNPISTIPNDVKSFAEWCWGQNKTCKEGNGNKCYQNLYKYIK